MLTRRKFIHFAAFHPAVVKISAGLTLPTLLTGQANAAARKSQSYGSHKLDIYPAQSAGNSRAPIVIYVHGGAWRGGSRNRVGSKAKYFTSKGRVFVSVGYTLFPSADAMAQARQIGQAVNWVRANAASMGGNANRLVLMGHSAGCHLAALATFTGAARGVRALICNDTRAYDLPLLAKTNKGRIPRLYSALDDASNWRRWSPISYVGQRRQPPTLVAWSGGAGRKALSLHFAGALRRVGTRVELFDGSARYSHSAINSRIGSENGGITSAVTKFIDRHVG
ncbi:MAG: alpha/beta hydrolase [Hyphomicrobiales bacterium]|nr:alpha/beta hydrolase [Hyphomicrobiales bacterium]